MVRNKENDSQAETYRESGNQMQIKLCNSKKYQTNVSDTKRNIIFVPEIKLDGYCYGKRLSIVTKS